MTAWFYLVNSVACSLAQSVNPYVMEHYTDENGLPQNSINAIAEDSKGFLWFGTESGLVRFDGQSFFAFDKAALGTQGNRIRYFLPATGTPGPEKPLFYSCDGVNTYVGVFPDSYPRKVDHYPDQQIRNALTNAAKEAKIHQILSLPRHFAFYIDTLKSPDMGILAVGNNEYYFRRNGNVAYYRGANRVYSVNVPENQGIFYRNGELFAARQDGSLIRIERGGSQMVALRGDILKDADFEQKKSKITYFWNNVSFQLFAHLSGNLYRINTIHKNTADTELLLTGMDLEKHGVLCIYEDDNQNIYLGCRTEGLYYFRRKQFQVAVAPEDSIGSVFYSIAPAGDNAIITRQGYRINLSPDSPPIRQDKSKLGHFWLWSSLAKDKQGNLWMAETSSPVDRQLSKYTADGKKLLARWDVPGAVAGTYCDPSGTIWFETDVGVLYYLSSKESAGTTPRRFVTTKLGGINSFYRSGSNQLWLGTSIGLYAVDIRSKAITTFKDLIGKNVRNIYGAGNELWICTYGDGLYLYKGNRLTHFPLDKEKYLSSVHCIVADRQQRFWLSTNNGLFVVSKADLLRYAAGEAPSPYYYYFDKASGFNTNEFNGGCQPCGIRLQSGNIVFPSINGVVYFNPDSLTMEYPDKEILISEILVDGKPVKVGGSITVERNFGQMQLLISTPFFQNKKNIRLSYKVSNGEGSGPWIPVTDQGRIYLSGLNPGDNVLNIKKIDGFGKDNASFTSVKILVPPYWYETSWFAAVLILLTLIVIYFFFKARVKYQAKMSYNQNLLNNARLYGDIITSINHDVQTPMLYVIYSLEQINEYLASPGQSDARYSKVGAEALSSLRRINALTNNLLHYLKVNLYQNKHSIATTSVELRPLISDIVEMFSAKIARDHINVSNLVSEDEEVILNPQVFSVILHNLIDNAVKVSKEGTITISTTMHQGKRQLLIEDSGRGMPAAVSDFLMADAEIFKPADRDHVDSRMSHTGGLGLIIVKDLCQLSGINLDVVSRPGNGTRIYLAALQNGN